MSKVTGTTLRRDCQQGDCLIVDAETGDGPAETPACRCSFCSYGIKQTYVSDIFITPRRVAQVEKGHGQGHVHAGLSLTGLAYAQELLSGMDRSTSSPMLARVQHLRVEIDLCTTSGRRYLTPPCRPPGVRPGSQGLLPEPETNASAKFPKAKRTQ